MAIKSSNQITIAEHKKILEIKEWYLATNKNEGVTIDTSGWTTSVQTIDATNKYLWNYEETVYSLGSSDITTPVIIGVYGETGSVGASLQVKYISSTTTPVIVNNNVNAWSDTVPIPQDGERVYMTQKLSTDTQWSAPIQISAVDGANGEANVEINEDGYWVINGEITGVKAEGSNGLTPEITIGTNGNWYINGIDSGAKAQGEAGKDGADIEYVYYRTMNASNLSVPSYTNGNLTAGWTASPRGITETYKYEYVSVRNKPSGGEWSAFSTPVVWSKWGEKGQDGDGVEYKYYLKNDSTVPTYPTSDNKWTDEPTGVSIDNQYEYVIQIKTVNGVSSPAEKASLWAKYGEDGAEGRGIDKIENYYATTTDASVTPTSWSSSVPKLTPTDKYLWNIEYIFYTDGSLKKTTPAIIGVYGDSGANAVDFQIYSVDGFEFHEGLDEIELRTFAYQGGESISTKAAYQWKWWNPESTEEDKYENIEGETSSSLIVNKDALYALCSLKCEMAYDGILYSDYVSLTEKSSSYMSSIKFFDGSNIVSPTKNYIAAYVEVYLDGNVQETIATGEYYDGNSSIQDDGLTITTDISETSNREFLDGDLMYFIYMKPDYNYESVLGEYKENKWNVVTNSTKYFYKNGNQNMSSNIIVISKEDIQKTLTIDVGVYKNIYDEISITNTSATIIDINDPIISDTEPTNVKYGQLWLDTSVSPYALRIYTKQVIREYELGEEEQITVYSGTNSTSGLKVYQTLLCADGVCVLDDGAIGLVGEVEEVKVSYNDYTKARALCGRYYSAKTKKYYIQSNATVSRMTKTTYAYVYVSNAQEIIPKITEQDGWVYFSQQNGGTVYTSIPLTGYSKGDLWIISDSDVNNNKDYPKLFEKYGPGTMLKAIVGSSTFDENHWTDSMEEISATIKNIKETFSWGDDGLKIMQQVTDSNGNITNPFYVHIDSTRMGFHSVSYSDNNEPDDQEVVHIGINSAVIKNASFVDNNTRPEEYTEYEGTNGVLFDCKTQFNNGVNMYNEKNKSGFTFKIESNGSLSLALLIQ